MNLSFGEKYEELRAAVRAFCAESWPLRGEEARLGERDQAIAWRTRAIAAGFLHRTVPRAYGDAGAAHDVMGETVIRQELDRAGPPLSAIAGRWVERAGVDAAAELKKLETKDGEIVNRFERPPVPFERIRDPEQARQIFAQLDGNSNGQLEPKEIPEPLQQPLERFSRLADRDRDGKLSRREFLDGVERMARFVGRRQPDAMPARDAKKERDSRPANGE